MPAQILGAAVDDAVDPPVGRVLIDGGCEGGVQEHDRSFGVGGFGQPDRYLGYQQVV